MYTITKSFQFCYGHRLWGDCGRCANLHGHTARVEVELSSKETNEHGMAYDFRDVSKIVGEWLKNNWDHKTILNKKDPLCDALRAADEIFVAIDGNPTVENLAKLLFDSTKELGLNVSRVIIWESEKSSATYSTSL